MGPGTITSFFLLKNTIIEVLPLSFEKMEKTYSEENKGSFETP